MVERIPRGMGSRCGVKTICSASRSELLEQFAGVPVREEAVGGEIVGRVHEVGFRGGRFARAGDAGFGVGNDAAVEIDPAGCR